MANEQVESINFNKCDDDNDEKEKYNKFVIALLEKFAKKYNDGEGKKDNVSFDFQDLENIISSIFTYENFSGTSEEWLSFFVEEDLNFNEEMQRIQDESIYFNGTDEKMKKSFAKFNKFFTASLKKFAENYNQDREETKDNVSFDFKYVEKIIRLIFTYEIFSKISEEWISFLTDKKTGNLLFDLCDNLVEAYSKGVETQPRFELVLQWMQNSNDPSKINYVIFGMEPLKTRYNFRESLGEAFSIRLESQVSLKNFISVFNVLKVFLRVSLKTPDFIEINEHEDENMSKFIVKKFSEGFTPTNMSRNGFLFYNMYPTVSYTKGQTDEQTKKLKEEQHEIWDAFSKKLLLELARNREIHLLAFYHSQEILGLLNSINGEHTGVLKLYTPSERKNSDGNGYTNHVAHWVINPTRNDINIMADSLLKNPELAKAIKDHFFEGDLQRAYKEFTNINKDITIIEDINDKNKK